MSVFQFHRVADSFGTLLMLLMGVASPYWMRAIDGAAAKLASPPPVVGMGMAETQ